MHTLGARVVDGGICDATAVAGYEAVLGRCIGVDLEAPGDVDFVLLWGCDAKRTVQHLWPTLRSLARKGVPVWVVDIYRTETMAQVESLGGQGLVITPGSDAALALGLARAYWETPVAPAPNADTPPSVDAAESHGQLFSHQSAVRTSMQRHCEGVDAFLAHLVSGFDAGATCQHTGLSLEVFQRLFDAMSRARTPLLKTGIGFARRRVGGMSMRAIGSMVAVWGWQERIHFESSDVFSLPEDFIVGAHRRPPGAVPPLVSHVGLGRVLEQEDIRLVFVWGHNPVATVPDAARVKAALSDPSTFLVVHENVMTETAALADVVLPATNFMEHADVYRSYGHRRLQFGRAAVVNDRGPVSNVALFSMLAQRLGMVDPALVTTSEDVCTSFLQESAQRLGGDVLDRVLSGEPVKLDPVVAAGDGGGGGGEPVDRGTPSGKIELVSQDLDPPMATFVPDDTYASWGDFWLTCAPRALPTTRHFRPVRVTPRKTVRPRLGCTRGGRNLRGKGGRQVVLSNPQGQVTLVLAISADVPKNMVRVDGVPAAKDIPEGIGINALVPGDPSPLGGGNPLYSARVNVAKAF